MILNNYSNKALTISNNKMPALRYKLDADIILLSVNAR